MTLMVGLVKLSEQSSSRAGDLVTGDGKRINSTARPDREVRVRARLRLIQFSFSHSFFLPWSSMCEM